MERKTLFTFIAVYSFALAVTLFFSNDDEINATTVVDQPSSYILQGNSTDAVVAAVQSVGGTVTHELGIINSVAATLTLEQRNDLLINRAILQISADAPVKTAGGVSGGSPGAYANFPSLVGADELHAAGITGRSVTVAILDSGMAANAELQQGYERCRPRVVKRYNAITDQSRATYYSTSTVTAPTLTSIILNTDYADDGTMRRNSIAPDVQVIPVKAFNQNRQRQLRERNSWPRVDSEQQGTLQHPVLNLSFSAPARSHYWDDPINQAVMKLWQAGVVVVASAGNNGPDAMTIGVPGNNPYVITVGAMSDNYTPADGSDDVLASFSSAQARRLKASSSLRLSRPVATSLRAVVRRARSPRSIRSFTTTTSTSRCPVRHRRQRLSAV